MPHPPTGAEPPPAAGDEAPLITVSGPLAEADAARVLRLAEVAAGRDAVGPLSEPVLLDLRYGGDAQARKAAHPQRAVHHRVVVHAHATGADRMEDGGGDAADGGQQFGRVGHRGAGAIFIRMIIHQTRRGANAAGQSDGLQGHGLVDRVSQIVGPDRRRHRRIGTE